MRVAVNKGIAEPIARRCEHWLDRALACTIRMTLVAGQKKVPGYCFTFCFCVSFRVILFQVVV
jgi:hypothetical protein